MSDLYRLRELAALLKPPIVEATKTHNQNFEGIKSIVDDCLADLEDKLGAGGAIETLLDKTGLSDLDNKKDADGKRMLERLALRTGQYAKEVQKIMVEIELMLASDPLRAE